jgi:hypothetical protein
MEIFNRILKDYSSTKQRLNHPQKDLKNFIEWIVNKLVTRLEKNPLMYVELLFPKTISDVKLLQNGYIYEIETKKRSKPRKIENDSADTTEETEKLRELQKQSENDKISKSRKSHVIEIECKSSLDWPSKIGVVVTILVNEGKLTILQWLQTVMRMVVRKRSKAADGKEPTDYIIIHENEEQKKALDSNPRVRLLLEIMSYVLKTEKKADKIEQSWMIPGYISDQDLLASVNWIQYYVDEPYKPNEGTVFDFIQEKKIELPKQRKPRNKRKSKEVDAELRQNEEIDKHQPEKSTQQRKRTRTNHVTNDDVGNKKFEKQKKKRIIPESDDDISEGFAELEDMDVHH